MYSSKATLDGVTNGIGAYIRSRNSWVKRSDGKTNLFTNFRALEAQIFKERLEYHDVSFCFVIQDKVTGKATISLNEAVKTEAGWQIARWETIYGQNYLHIYDITEVDLQQVINAGYISTKAADTHDPNRDPKYEYDKLKHIRSMVNKAAAELAKYQIYGVSLYKTKNGLDCKLDNTSATIHIWSNSKLMDYNTAIKQYREETQTTEIIRCLPYSKVDKYGTLYMFATCDQFDSQDNYTVTAINKFEEELIAMMQEMNQDAEVNYISCQFIGKVILNEKLPTTKEE